MEKGGSWKFIGEDKSHPRKIKIVQSNGIVIDGLLVDLTDLKIRISVPPRNDEIVPLSRIKAYSIQDGNGRQEYEVSAERQLSLAVDDGKTQSSVGYNIADKTSTLVRPLGSMSSPLTPLKGEIVATLIMEGKPPTGLKGFTLKAIFQERIVDWIKKTPTAFLIADGQRLELYS
ncbi:MAG: hypothetical protein ABIP78_07025 [Pyrinomonadaceae bacterium]